MKSFAEANDLPPWMYAWEKKGVHALAEACEVLRPTLF
jgi:hypothetical protein